MAPPAGVSVRVLAADGGAAAPAVHGESILGVLGVATARAGATALFDTAPVWLAEAGTGDQRAVLLAAAPPPDDQAQALLGSSAGCGVLTHLGRQHELWREIPRLRAGPPDPSKHVKARACCCRGARACAAHAHQRMRAHNVRRLTAARDVRRPPRWSSWWTPPAACC